MWTTNNIYLAEYINLATVQYQQKKNHLNNNLINEIRYKS